MNTNIGKPISDLTSPDHSDYITHGIIILTGLFILIQLISFFSGSGNKNASTVKGSSVLGQTSGKKKAGVKKHLLVCGPTNSGKTALFYHLLTKEVRPSVTSMEINETQGSMEVKIPGSAIG